MPLKEDIKKKLDRLESVPDSFISVVNKQNSELFKQLVKLLDSLELKDGFVVQSDKNLLLIEQISEIMSNVLFEGDYLQGLKDFISEFPIQGGINNSIISAQFDFQQRDLYNSAIKQSQRTALQLLDQSAIDNAVIKPLKDKLSTAIITGSKYSDIIQLIKDNILGAELEPKLSSYVGRYVYDAFAIFDRTYTQLITKDIEIELWEYSGGVLKESREFCIARHDHVYTTEEIASWASEDWQGKNAATDETTIFSYLGGYNCQHSLIPRSVETVPESEINIYN